jgi:photosystem II stability/assembly factor-like uncharacterized protein
MVFGMRGSLFSTSNAGLSWTKVSTGSPAGITGGTVMPDGTLVLVNQAGGINRSLDKGKTFVAFKPTKVMPYFGVVALGGNRIGLAGPEGVKVETVQ